MGNYNDFDLDIKKVQEVDNTEPASVTTIVASIKACTDLLSCNGTCSCVDTCKASCGGLTTSCSAHCR